MPRVRRRAYASKKPAIGEAAPLVLHPACTVPELECSEFLEQIPDFENGPKAWGSGLLVLRTAIAAQESDLTHVWPK